MPALNPTTSAQVERLATECGCQPTVASGHTRSARSDVIGVDSDDSILGSPAVELVTREIDVDVIDAVPVVNDSLVEGLSSNRGFRSRTDRARNLPRSEPAGLCTRLTCTFRVDLGGHNKNRHVGVDGPAFALD